LPQIQKAFATQSLTLTTPAFNLKPVPTKNKSPPTPASISAAPKNSMQPASTTAKSSTHAPRGQLHVKLIQARGLAVKSALSRPYVVVVYEQNEFISREPTHEGEKEVKGKPNPLSRQSSSVNVTAVAPTAQMSSAMNALGGIQKAFDIKPKTTQSTATKSAESPETANAGAGEDPFQSSSRSSSGSSGGSKAVKTTSIHNAASPVWKHQVSL
jgi:serine/threonine protein kinase SCH9